MKLLVANGADVNGSPYRGTALLWAIYSDCVPAAEWLLDHGADPDLRHDFGGKGHGVQAVALHLLNEHLTHCVADALTGGGTDAEAKVAEASAAIARLVRS